ncbi:TPA: thioredoxin family protein [Pseudomonas aeruginosa]|nr:thioredoxin [Stenotrophomonas sp.]HEJ1322156.1 thioredoxin family protein [Pseudomonas aeruginosa]
MADIENLSIDSFSRILGREAGQAVVYFSASWCQPCQSMRPVFIELVRRIVDLAVAFGTVDIAQSPTIAPTYGIRSVPSIAVFRQGKLVALIPGEVPVEQAEVRVRQALAL